MKVVSERTRNRKPERVGGAEADDLEGTWDPIILKRIDGDVRLSIRNDKGHPRSSRSERGAHFHHMNRVRLLGWKAHVGDIKDFDGGVHGVFSKTKKGLVGTSVGA